MAVGLGPELGGLLGAGLPGNTEGPAKDESGTEGAGMNNQIAIRHEQGAPDFQILGAFQLIIGGRPHEIGPEQEQRLLVALLSARGMPVIHDKLMAAIWDDLPKNGALNDLYHLVGGLRKRLAVAGLDGVPTAANGTYRLDIPPAGVDVHRFHDLVARARGLTDNDDQQAVALFEAALRLHRGEPLAGLRGRWIGGYRHLLTEERHAAELALYEAAIRAGESRERIPALNSLFLDRPGDEGVAWLYMHALYRVGRQSDALEVWHTVRRHLDNTIGAASVKALSDLHERILRHDDDLFRPEAVKFLAGEGATRPRVPGRPGSQAGREEPDGAAPALPDDLPDGGSDTPGAAEQDPNKQRGIAGVQTHTVFNGSVFAEHGVFGSQINYGPPR
jgi:DNA-binding SARP family transcriptional activator